VVELRNLGRDLLAQPDPQRLDHQRVHAGIVRHEGLDPVDQGAELVVLPA
jgi:hypothetical protein